MKNQMQGNTCISIKQKAEGKNEENEENMGTHAYASHDALPAARCSNGGRGGILLAQQKHAVSTEYARAAIYLPYIISWMVGENNTMYTAATMR